MRRALLAVAVALTLSACATTQPATPPSQPPVPPPVEAPVVPPESRGVDFAGLPGWAQEDHAAALDAFRAGCAPARSPPLAALCREARALGPVDREQARRFIEANFRPERVGNEGLLTAYFAPQYEARASRQGEFTAVLRPRPEDLATVTPYPDRAQIEAREEARPLAWMRPEEKFFLQIQGSGVLVLPDGRRVRALYDGTNGRPFTGIATAMRDRGLLAPDNTSGEAIRQWLADHRGPEADEIMQLNPRYGFFRTAPDDGTEPVGAANIPLPAGRAIAVDPSWHDFGALYWIDASAPTLTGAFPVYQRMVVALDTGGAIKGQVRADLYIGSGPAAGAEAGRVKHTLRMYRLVPVPR